MHAFLWKALPRSPGGRCGGGGARRPISDDIIHHHDHRASALCSRDSFLIHNLHALIRELNSPHLTHRQDSANLHLFIPGRPVWVETRESGWGQQESTRHRAHPPGPIAGAVCRWRRASSHGTVSDPRAHRATGGGTCMRKLACGAEARQGQPLAAQHTLVSMPVLVQVAALVLPEFLSSHMLMLLPPATEHLPIRTCQFAAHTALPRLYWPFAFTASLPLPPEPFFFPPKLSM